MSKLLFVGSPSTGRTINQPEVIQAQSVDATVATALAASISTRFTEWETARNELFALCAQAERERHYVGAPGRLGGDITSRADRIAVLEGELAYLQTALFGLTGATRRPIVPGVPRSERFRVTLAQVNAGFTLVGAIPGYAFRMRDVTIIAIGGAAAAVTTVDILGTLAASSRKLVAFGQAALTQSTPLFPGVAGATILADGASFTANDAGTAITIGKTGATITGPTHFDVLLDFVVD